MEKCIAIWIAGSSLILNIIQAALNYQLKRKIRRCANVKIYIHQSVSGGVFLRIENCGPADAKNVDYFPHDIDPQYSLSVYYDDLILPIKVLQAGQRVDIPAKIEGSKCRSYNATLTWDDDNLKNKNKQIVITI